MSMDQQNGMTPYLLTSPQVGRSPTIPFTDAGIRIEPPVSSPRVSEASDAAIAIPDPLLERPGV